MGEPEQIPVWTLGTAFQCKLCGQVRQTLYQTLSCSIIEEVQDIFGNCPIFCSSFFSGLKFFLLLLPKSPPQALLGEALFSSHLMLAHGTSLKTYRSGQLLNSLFARLERVCPGPSTAGFLTAQFHCRVFDLSRSSFFSDTIMTLFLSTLSPVFSTCS